MDMETASEELDSFTIFDPKKNSCLYPVPDMTLQNQHSNLFNHHSFQGVASNSDKIEKKTTIFKRREWEEGLRGK